MAPAKAKKKKRSKLEKVPEAAEVVAKPGKKKRKRKAATCESEALDAVPPAAAKRKKRKEAVDAVPPATGKRKKRKKVANPDGQPPHVDRPDELADVQPGAGKKAASKLSAEMPPAVPAKSSEDWTVFVDGVPYVWTVSKVDDHFRQCGDIKEVRAPTWQDSGRLRGFAHVTFKDKAGRDKALAMNGTQVDKKGRYFKIELAKAPSAAEGPSAADIEGKRRLFVKNLPYDATEKEIAEIFAKCGKIREVRVPTSFGRAKGFAYVEFAGAEHLKAAIAMKPPPSLRGRVLRLDADTGRGPKAGFHYRTEAIDSGYGPGRGSGKGRGGREGGKGGGRGPPKLSLF